MHAWWRFRRPLSCFWPAAAAAALDRKSMSLSFILWTVALCFADPAGRHLDCRLAFYTKHIHDEIFTQAPIY